MDTFLLLSYNSFQLTTRIYINTVGKQYSTVLGTTVQQKERRLRTKRNQRSYANCAVVSTFGFGTTKTKHKNNNEITHQLERSHIKQTTLQTIENRPTLYQRLRNSNSTPLTHNLPHGAPALLQNLTASDGNILSSQQIGLTDKRAKLTVGQ